MPAWMTCDACNPPAKEADTSWVAQWIARAAHALAATQRFTLACALTLLAALAPPAHAHKASDAYLLLAPNQDPAQAGTLTLRWDVALRDLDTALGLDADGDGRLRWGEVRRRADEIDAHLLSRLRIEQMGGQGDEPNACRLSPQHPAPDHDPAPPLERRIDGTYHVLRLAVACPGGGAGPLRITYTLLADLDPTHRGLLRVGGSAHVVSLDPNAPAPTVDLVDRAHPGAAQHATTAAAFTAFVRDGIHHILIGADHVLFLLCLLLPAVLTAPAHAQDRRPTRPVPRWRDAVRPVLITVTAFTVAHSITLALASLGWVVLPPRLVEPAIALTIALAAWDNLRPLFKGRRHLFTFLFGLVHGFGFAGVLGELALPASGFAWALLGFNVGVEVGQLMLVVPALAVLLALRRRPAYVRWVVPVASCVAIVLAAGWFVERVFDLGFMPV